ncbi:hypothetical protein A3Q56_02571 [Intoshia linei]|uniref:Small ribosomal subunit protein bS16m n=1 Tax=Intoshia linei TaxID=1819745 RepID=A0A177B634_9BILA|nr:hypothetical protein A3Q56_02571 [Intoshia linei]
MVYKVDAPIIRFIRRGCTNRPFYQLAIQNHKSSVKDHPIENIGWYDPMPNKRGEIMCGINFDRLKYWISKDVPITKQVLKILGIFASRFFKFLSLGTHLLCQKKLYN